MQSCIDVRPIIDRELNEHSRRIFKAAVTSVDPRYLIRQNVHLDGKKLTIKGERFKLKKPCYVVGFGKAVMGMAVQLEAILGKQLKEGIVMIPTGIREQFAESPQLLPVSGSRIRFVEGARNNLPDAEARAGAEQIKKLCDNLSKDDFLIVLISGGGSALLPLPPPGVELEEKLWLIKELEEHGADIPELNCVRKRMSQLKGGGLAESAYPATVITLILSDVIDDPIDFIASGPTVRNLDDSDAALKILDKYGLTTKLPPSIENILKLQKKQSNDFSHVKNFVIGNNKIACAAAKAHAESLNYDTIILSTSIHGDVDKLAKMYAQLSIRISQAMTAKSKIILDDLVDLNINDITGLDLNKSICLIAGGEPTFVVKGNGKGGRNLQLVLQVCEELGGKNLLCDVRFLSGSTEGIDGTTDAAGALGFDDLQEYAVLENNLHLNTFLKENDAYTFFERYRNGCKLIKTGPTGTNVSDIHVLIIQPKIIY